MAKAKKQETISKQARKFSLLRAFLILIGADLLLLLAPGFGLLNSMFYIGEVISWASLFIGLVLLVFGFKGLFRKV